MLWVDVVQRDDHFRTFAVTDLVPDLEHGNVVLADLWEDAPVGGRIVVNGMGDRAHILRESRLRLDQLDFQQFFLAAQFGIMDFELV